MLKQDKQDLLKREGIALTGTETVTQLDKLITDNGLSVTENTGTSGTSGTSGTNEVLTLPPNMEGFDFDATLFRSPLPSGMYSGEMVKPASVISLRDITRLAHGKHGTSLRFVDTVNGGNPIQRAVILEQLLGNHSKNVANGITTTPFAIPAGNGKDRLNPDLRYISDGTSTEVR